MVTFRVISRPPHIPPLISLFVSRENQISEFVLLKCDWFFFFFKFWDAVSPVPGCREGSPIGIRWASQDLPHEALGHQRGSRQVQVLVRSMIWVCCCRLRSWLIDLVFFFFNNLVRDIWLIGVWLMNLDFRYFLRKLKKVKKSNGQVLAINEVHPF